MKKEFHYCAIRVIAEKAGFSPSDAQIIAYASQYVDDAVEHKEMTIKGIPKSINYVRVNQNKFDPTCTAHKGLYLFASYKKESQLKVYIPFHFVPNQKYSSNGSYNYLVKPNGSLALELINDALQLIKANNQDDELKKRYLIKLGIALHTYADTWAHQEFSGRRSSNDNDIEKVRLIKNGKEIKQDIFTTMTGFIPDIGHAEAQNYPDETHLKWSFVKSTSGKQIIRDNTEIFLDAAEQIFNLLSQFHNNQNQFKTIRSKLEKCFKVEHRNYKDNKMEYIKEFPTIFNNPNEYDELEWRNEALKNGSTNFLGFDIGDYLNQNYNFNGDLKWFYFHWEAWEQRRKIVNLIKQDLL